MRAKKQWGNVGQWDMAPSTLPQQRKSIHTCKCILRCLLIEAFRSLCEMQYYLSSDVTLFQQTPMQDMNSEVLSQASNSPTNAS